MMGREASGGAELGFVLTLMNGEDADIAGQDLPLLLRRPQKSEGISEPATVRSGCPLPKRHVLPGLDVPEVWSTTARETEHDATDFGPGTKCADSGTDDCRRRSCPD